MTGRSRKYYINAKPDVNTIRNMATEQEQLPTARTISLTLGIPLEDAEYLLDLAEIRLNVEKQRKP